MFRFFSFYSQYFIEMCQCFPTKEKSIEIQDCFPVFHSVAPQKLAKSITPHPVLLLCLDSLHLTNQLRPVLNRSADYTVYDFWNSSPGTDISCNLKFIGRKLAGRYLPVEREECPKKRPCSSIFRHMRSETVVVTKLLFS